MELQVDTLTSAVMTIWSAQSDKEKQHIGQKYIIKDTETMHTVIQLVTVRAFSLLLKNFYITLHFFT